MQNHLLQRDLFSNFQTDIDDSNILSELAILSSQAAQSMSALIKTKYAAYFTPPALSNHMVSIANYQGGKLGDKGAGAGILSATAAARHLMSGSDRRVMLHAHEIQPDIQKYLESAYEKVKELAGRRDQDVRYAIDGDFTQVTKQALTRQYGDYDDIIINPPYFKIPANGELNNAIFEALGFRVPNIYAAFILLSLHLLKEGGALTALVPRSFFNGRYFKPFRRHIKQIASIDSVTRYRSRSNAFKNENVLQENCVVRFVRARQKDTIELFTCECPDSPAGQSMQVKAQVLLDNPHDVFLLPADKAELDAYIDVSQQSLSLSQLGIKVSTGKVVEYRVNEHLNSVGNGAMFIEGKSLDTNYVTYTPKYASNSKGNALEITEHTQKFLIPADDYILFKRISSNTDIRRMHATVLREEDCKTGEVALSNHIQYLHGARLRDNRYALALAAYLQSEKVELAMSTINGTTQLNVDDFDLIRVPKSLFNYMIKK